MSSKGSSLTVLIQLGISAAHQAAQAFRDSGRGDVRAIASTLNTAGYLTVSTYGEWSTSEPPRVSCTLRYV